ncbi:hypothetical protein [Leptospira noguchii]|nr:hypothetical protein [Leptospira noguchii]UOG29565.1 hypothetical protein MAL06_12935 [Leptospira noguchii]
MKFASDSPQFSYVELTLTYIFRNDPLNRDRIFLDYKFYFFIITNLY